MFLAGTFVALLCSSYSTAAVRVIFLSTAGDESQCYSRAVPSLTRRLQYHDMHTRTGTTRRVPVLQVMLMLTAD